MHPQVSFLFGEYVNVPAVSCKADQLSVPQLAFGNEAAGLLEVGMVDEQKWFQHGMKLLTKERGLRKKITYPGLHFMLL